MSCLKQWKVGRRVLGLMASGVVVIAERRDGGGFPDEQFTLASGLPGLIAIRDTLNEVIDEIKSRRKQKE